MKITLKHFIEAVNFKIKDSGAFGWECYGENAYMLDAFNENASGTVVYDTKKFIVYELRYSDYKKEVAYKWINPKFVKKHNSEMKSRGFESDQAWDSINYTETNAKAILKLLGKIK